MTDLTIKTRAKALLKAAQAWERAEALRTGQTIGTQRLWRELPPEAKSYWKNLAQVFEGGWLANTMRVDFALKDSQDSPLREPFEPLPPGTYEAEVTGVTENPEKPLDRRFRAAAKVATVLAVRAQVLANLKAIREVFKPSLHGWTVESLETIYKLVINTERLLSGIDLDDATLKAQMESWSKQDKD